MSDCPCAATQGYWWEGSNPAAVPPSAYNAVGQIGGFIFGAGFVLCNTSPFIRSFKTEKAMCNSLFRVHNFIIISLVQINIY